MRKQVFHTLPSPALSNLSSQPERSFNAPHQHLPSAFPFFGRALSTWFDANSQWRLEENLSTVTKSRVFLSPPLGNETILWKLFSSCTLPFQKTFEKKVFWGQCASSPSSPYCSLGMLLGNTCAFDHSTFHVSLSLFPLILLPVFGKNEFRGKRDSGKNAFHPFPTGKCCVWNVLCVDGWNLGWFPLGVTLKTVLIKMQLFGCCWFKIWGWSPLRR